MEAECYFLIRVGDPMMTPQTLIHILITDPSKLTHPPNQMAAFMHSFCGSEPNSRHQGMRRRQTDMQRECCDVIA